MADSGISSFFWRDSGMRDLDGIRVKHFLWQEGGISRFLWRDGGIREFSYKQDDGMRDFFGGMAGWRNPAPSLRSPNKEKANI